MSPSAPRPVAQPPVYLVFDRQRAVRVDLLVIRRVAQIAADACLSRKAVKALGISLVSDRVISRLHRQFLKLAGPTDVITFAHGEIVLSAETAARAARELGEPVEREICRYVVHGILHLRGYTDETPRAAAALWRRQEALLARFWSAAGSKK